MTVNTATSRKHYQHPCYESINDVALSCESYFKHIELNFFGHIRVFQNGEFFFLCSGHAWPRWSFGEQSNPPAGFTRFAELQSGIYFPSMDNPDNILGWSPEFIAQSRQQFNITHPMAIIKHYGDFYDFFFFDINSSNPYETYLGELNSFYNFIDWHKDNKHELIQRVGKQLLKVDEKYQLQKMSQAVTVSCGEPEPQFYELFTHGNFIRITRKEFQCLQSLAKGANTKNIANRLNLSHRTIEHRVSALKTKLHCHSTQRIIELFWANFSDRP